MHASLKPCVVKSSSSVPDTMALVKAAATKCGFSKISVNDDSTLLQCIDTTKLVKFVDDIVVEIRNTNEIHIRSKSRLGAYDFGANRKRIERFQSVLTGSS
eukprot:TRINITY_DN1233_c0_g1_i1.p1 TRINITY_DN1233_c0_g1~~TRINITY_DN1233_c0_g1_i1.p1  ORF type:complete len:101 (-),score=24.84 TRINITY_DN1233_c0_g1_i1:192-494(-)